MSRPARALLDAGALRHNLQEVRRRAPRSRVMAIVKANGYGHGLAWAAGALVGDADAFGVASVDEALTLRTEGIVKPICLLEGFFQAAELPLLAQHQLAPVVHNDVQLRALESARLPKSLSVWIKLDTGMHRLGFPPEAFASVLARLKAAPSVGACRVLSHFADAENPDGAVTREQLRRFQEQALGGIEASIANSAGIIAWPQAHLDWVRPGIMLYGGSPFADKSAAALNLKPVMTLATELIAVSRRRRGDAIGYNGEFRCPEDMSVGVAAIGYGDGYPRRMPPGTPVLVNGKRIPIAGRVSMDMITLDLRSQPDAKVGDAVVLWGTGLPADEIATCAGTVSYELFCHVAPRVARVTIE